MQSRASTYTNDFLISGGISVALSPIVIILISVIVQEWPDGYAGIGPTFIGIWGIFAMIGTLIFFIISLFTDEGLAAILRRHTGGKDVEMILPHSLAPSDTISEWKTQEFTYEQKENVIESEKVPEVEESSMEKLEKLIERRNVDAITSEEFEEMKKDILERKPQVSKDPIEIAQEGVHSDDVPRKENRDEVVSKSNIGSGGDDKLTKIKELKELLDSGAIDDDEFKQMKKEILGK